MNTGLTFTYRARNNTVYLIIVGDSSNPSVKIELKHFIPSKITVVIVNETVKVDNDSNETIIVDNIINITQTNLTSLLSKNSPPKYASLVILACIMAGSLLFVCIECFTR